MLEVVFIGGKLLRSLAQEVMPKAVAERQSRQQRQQQCALHPPIRQGCFKVCPRPARTCLAPIHCRRLLQLSLVSGVGWLEQGHQRETDTNIREAKQSRDGREILDSEQQQPGKRQRALRARREPGDERIPGRGERRRQRKGGQQEQQASDRARQNVGLQQPHGVVRPLLGQR